VASQGGIISPLLANIYLNLVDKAVSRKDGVFFKYGITIVRYADDFVLMGRKIPEHCLSYLHGMLDKMELTINAEKSQLVDAQTEPFDFLGFTFRYDWDISGRNQKYLNIIPRKESEKNVRRRIKEYLGYSGHKNPQALSKGLNQIMRGWLNYITTPQVSYPKKAKRNLRWYLVQKSYRYYQRKSQCKCKLYRHNAFEVLERKYGLINPVKYNYV